MALDKTTPINQYPNGTVLEFIIVMQLFFEHLSDIAALIGEVKSLVLTGIGLRLGLGWIPFWPDTRYPADS